MWYLLHLIYDNFIMKIKDFFENLSYNIKDNIISSYAYCNNCKKMTKRYYKEIIPDNSLSGDYYCSKCNKSYEEY